MLISWSFGSSEDPKASDSEATFTIFIQGQPERKLIQHFTTVTKETNVAWIWTMNIHNNLDQVRQMYHPHTWAATVWERVGNNLVMQAVLKPCSERPIAALNPAPPAPTTTASYVWSTMVYGARPLVCKNRKHSNVDKAHATNGTGNKWPRLTKTSTLIGVPKQKSIICGRNSFCANACTILASSISFDFVETDNYSSFMPSNWQMEET